MAKQTSVSDPYLDSITAQITEINETIKANNARDFAKIAELEKIKAHYSKFKKMMTEGK